METHHRHIIFRAAVIALAIAGSAMAQTTYTWVGTSQSWNPRPNWGLSAGALATTDQDAMVFHGSGDLILDTFIQLDRTINSLSFNENADSHVLIQLGGTIESKNITFAGTNPHITVDAGSAGSHVIGSNDGFATRQGSVVLNADLQVAHEGSGTLTIQRPITEDGTARGITKTGSGTLVFSRANTYTGTTTVADGTLRVDNPNFAATSTVTIGASGVLELPNPGTSTVAALVINGSPQPAGTYDAGNSGGRITGAGKIAVAGAGSDTDTDGDGLDDEDEINGSLNRWKAGVFGKPPGDPTDPFNPDSDGDGLNDGDEIAAGTDPNLPAPHYVRFVDSDGDGYRDDAEIAMGSAPNNAADIPDYTPKTVKPNVVIIYADDLGLGDISRYGAIFGTSSPSPTPHVDSLADQGVAFTQAHSANAVCTPSRYSLLTGIYNWRTFQNISGHYGQKAGIDNIPPAGDVTIAQFLKSQGYDTAAFGKWHLGGKWHAPGTNTRITTNPTDPGAVDWTRRVEGHATDIGFDLFRGLGTTINRGPYVYLHDDIVHYWVENVALNEYGDKLPHSRRGYFRPATGADSFIWLDEPALSAWVVGAKASTPSLGDPSYRQVDAEPIMIADFEHYIEGRLEKSDPFFAYVALYSPHSPYAITPAFNNATYGSYDYARFMAEFDDRIGRILAAIDNNGMRENTMVIFTSDNGPETVAMNQSLANSDDSNGPLRGVKRDAWEGGTRVPFIVRWPGQAPAGMVVTDEVISQVDIFPTIAAFLGAELPATTAPDGESFLNVLRGQRKPGAARGGVVLSSVNGHLALKAPDGWKLLDTTGGGGNNSTWDSKNNKISDALGTNRGAPKQLFHLPVDLGEDNNRIAGVIGDTTIRSQLLDLTGRDLLDVLDQLRSNGAASLYPRVPDNDGDGMSNAFETTYGLNRDDPKDAALDMDGDGADNLSEYIAGTDPTDPGSVFRVFDLTDDRDTLTVTWPSVLGRHYTVSWSSDLAAWTQHSAHAGSGTFNTVTLDKTEIDAVDGTIGNLRALFVRVAVTAP